MVLGVLVDAGEYLIANWPRFTELLTEHLQLVLVSELVAIGIALPLGVAATWNDRASSVITTLGNVAQTIPTLAVIALVFPILGLGFRPALVGLAVYALLPILTNTVAGLESVDDGTVEAARGMGMTRWEVLKNVRFPQAVPVIFAGIRTSVVLNVGTAYLAFFIGGGGLGVWVIGGIKLFSTAQLLAGAIPGALLAVALDAGLALVERRVGATETPDGVAAAG
ncbi:ABC transporter permease subunit [Halomarina oriensis]|uniref:ABC transporter permease subunit n=2 Tax=Halomarina oriensis TaxID=671145 RepID=A0A6B0GTY0_9EURY|nr:ABC transporter permease [Halomarina oriensis]MWG36827.1 ABC transporter permease subunit [Halomarina oriensis]